MSDEQQAVVEPTEEQPTPAPEAADAPDTGNDLDALLAEYAAKVPEPTQPQPEQPDSDTQNRLEQLERSLSEREFKTDMNDVVTQVRGDLDAGFFDDRLIEAWVDAEARGDPRLQKAWSNRHNDPSGFKKVVGGLNKKFADKFGKLPDPVLTEDRDAVANAVRGASATKAPEGAPPDYSRMSNAEFNEAVRKEHGYSPKT